METSTGIVAFGASDEPTMEYDSVLAGTTMTTGPTASANPCHSQEFDDQEDNAPMVPVQDDVAVYSAEEHQKLKEIQSHFYKMFPPSHTNYYANPQALEAVVLAEAQGRGSNDAIQGSSIDLIPAPHKRRKIISMFLGVLVPSRLASLWQVNLLKESLQKPFELPTTQTIFI